MDTPPSLSGEAFGYDVADKRIDILRRIGSSGSISEAARGAGISYKAAWQALDTLTNLAGTPLVQRTVGGSGGGGAVLTAAGEQLLSLAETLHTLRQQVLRSQGHAYGRATLSLASLGLQTSMRNQLPCRVVGVTGAGRGVCVELSLHDQTPLYARITAESAELLGLLPGVELLALAKATAVNVITASDPPQLGRNRLTGRVDRISRAPEGDEVVIALQGGLQIVGFCEPGCLLELGAAASAVLEDSAVVLATTR